MVLRGRSHHGIRWGVAVGLSAGLLLLAYLLLPAPSAAAHGAETHAQGTTYLALGDSLAFGYSQAVFDEHFSVEDPEQESPSYYEHGYVNDFAEFLQSTGLAGSNLQVVNDGCPGETTESMIKGPCAYEYAGYPLHHPYAGSQLAAAVKYLEDHPNEVSPITIDIGANDVLAMLRSCEEPEAPEAPEACILKAVPELFEDIAGKLGSILGKLRAAAPQAQIIVLGLYNPFGESIPHGDQLTAQLNEAMAQVAAGLQARFADPLQFFNPPGEGQQATLCLLTNMCTPLADVHPTPLGYEVLARVIERQYLRGLPH